MQDSAAYEWDMSLVIILAAAAISPSPAPKAQTQAQATIRILQGVRVTEENWKSAKRRTDRILRDALGRETRLRTIDFE